MALERFMNNTKHQLDEMWAQCDARERSVRQEMEDARSGHTVEIAQMTAERQDAIRALNESWSGNAAEWAKEKEALLASHAEEVQRLKAEAARDSRICRGLGRSKRSSAKHFGGTLWRSGATIFKTCPFIRLERIRF